VGNGHHENLALTAGFSRLAVAAVVENLDKRQVKAPKVCLRDSGLLHAPRHRQSA